MVFQKDIVRAAFEGANPGELLDDLEGELKARNYLITRINNIDNILKRENLGERPIFAFRFYKIVEFCNLESCSKLISSNLLAGVFLPTRYIVFQPNDDTRIHIAFLKPTAFARLFDSSEMQRLAEILEKDMHDILEEIDF